MIPLASLASLAFFLVGAQAGTKIWDGSFNPYNSASDFDKCEFVHVLCSLTALVLCIRLGRVVVQRSRNLSMGNNTSSNV